MFHTVHTLRSGTDWLKSPMGLAILALAPVALGGILSMVDLMIGLVIAATPILLLFIGGIFINPRVGLYSVLVLSFLATGLSRYLPLPWGLAIDVLLTLSVVGLFIQKFYNRDWGAIQNDYVLWMAVWYGYVCLLLFNPEAPGPTAWFYAMRGIGFHLLLGFILTFSCLRRPSHIDKIIHIVLIFSVFGALWGLRQKFIGLDWAEEYWIWDEGHHEEHVLHGVLRAFSFYSDAGQFGASQAMVASICGILILGPASWKKRLVYLCVMIITLLGFLYSGTRGALAVPFGAGLLYLILSKNFKILTAGVVAMILAFCVLKYTYLFHSFQPVARIRTALTVDNPSLQARLRNQRTFAAYLRTRPLGGGVGSAGYWGERFRPGSLLANTPTDSYYVKLWAETGLVGVSMHMLMLGFFLGRGSYIVWHLRDPALRYKIMALLCAFAGVLLSSYGNQVFTQFPTGIIMAIALPLIFMSPSYDAEIEEEKRKKEHI